MSDYDHLFKILLVGDSLSGKSSLLLQYCDNQFTQNYIATIGVDFKIKTIEVNPNIIKLQIWDTAGQDRFKTITSSYYRGAHSIVLIFNCNERSTFENLENWFEEIKKFANEDVLVSVCANFCESKERAVSTEEAWAFARKIKASYYEASALTGVGVNELFSGISLQLISPRITEETTTIDNSSVINASLEVNLSVSEETKSESAHETIFKIILVGDSRVGKSSILSQFDRSSFSDSYLPTIGVDFLIKSVVFNETPIKLQIWDTSGQERFRTITASYYRGATAIIIVCDCTDASSFENIHKWLAEINEYCSKNIPVLICTNKSDFPERVISNENGRSLAKELKIPYYETSAKNNIGITEMFNGIISQILAAGEDRKSFDGKKVKVLVIGDSASGKSALSAMYTSNFSQTGTKSIVKSINSQQVLVEICEIENNDESEEKILLEFQEADVFVFIYHCSEETSFTNLHRYLDDTRKVAKEQCKKVVVGNLDEGAKAVISGRAQAVADHYNASFAEISIKDKESIENLITGLVEKAL